MRHDPERFVTFVLGSFMLLFYLGIAWQTIRVRRRIGRCPIPALTEGGLGNWLHAIGALSWPLPVLAWSQCPRCFAGLPRLAFLENWPMRLLGLMLLSLASAVLIAAAAELGDAWRMGVESGGRPKLVHAGIYGSIRHPMYAAGWLALLGIFCLAPNLLFAMMWAFGGTAVNALAMREEAELEAALGEPFRRYRSVTGRFFPLWW